MSETEGVMSEIGLQWSVKGMRLSETRASLSERVINIKTRTVKRNLAARTEILIRPLKLTLHSSSNTSQTKGQSKASTWILR